MEVEFKKDLKNNYMIITEVKHHKIESYSTKILELQVLEGTLPVSMKRMDDRLLFYYEITAKQCMDAILDRASISYDKLKNLLLNIIYTIEKAYEYLLPEDDFIISPQYIFIDIKTNKPSLCYFPGYGMNIREQMNNLLEYLMNKVDYNDKTAVLLIYQLYAISKEDGFTFDYLLELLNGDIITNENEGNLHKSARKSDKSEFPYRDLNQNHNENKKESTSKQEELKDNNFISKLDIPVMMEKVEGEVERYYYPLRTYLYLGGSILTGIIIIIICLATKLLFNTFGNHIDYSKLFALILVIVCIEGYVINKLLDKKNKLAKIIKTCDYVDPRKVSIHNSIKAGRKIDFTNIKEKFNNEDNETSIHKRNLTMNLTRNNGKETLLYKDDSDQVPMNLTHGDEVAATDEDMNATCLLNSSEYRNTLILKAVDEINYKNIKIVNYPFFIGKLKKNMDYCLEDNVISRFHAKITKEGETYYLTDLNSTNGTYINQEPLQTYQKKEIKLGDEIAFANIKYLFDKV